MLHGGSGALLRAEAALERRVDAGLDGHGGFTHDFRDFRDDEELGAIEHALFAEREALRLREEGEALEHISHVVDGAAAHLVRVVLEAPLPVLVIVDLAVTQETEEPFDIVVADGSPEEVITPPLRLFLMP